MANGNHYIAVDAALARAYNSAPKTRQRKVQQALRRSLLAENEAKQLSQKLSALRQSLLTESEAKQKRLSKKETALLLKINHTLTEAQKLRFDQLNEKRLNAALTQQEFIELESLIRELEQIGVERLRAVIELARLRKIEPALLIQQLELEPLVQANQS